MKRTILIITLFALTFGISSAQQVPQFSQNMFNKLANNPGYTGSSETINAMVLHRSQWIGFEKSKAEFAKHFRHHRKFTKEGIWPM